MPHSFRPSINATKRVLLMAVLPLSLFMTGCFTGVEGTKKISLSRDDKKMLAVMPEDTFLNSLRGEPLRLWHQGRQFAVADGRISLLFDRGDMTAAADTIGINGRNLSFAGVGTRMRPDGNAEAMLVFQDGGNRYSLPSGKSPADALDGIVSDNLPMLIDLDQVTNARKLLAGKTLWIRTPLWYDSLGNSFKGRKFVPVKVRDVRAGTMVFPLRLTLSDENGNVFFQLMNAGNGNHESRSFAKLFRLSDPRSNYPDITDEVWALIQNGKVRLGMTKDECRLALGSPRQAESGHDYSSTLDLWQYDDGIYLRFQDGLLVDLLK